MAEQRFYSEEEAEQILRTAARNSPIREGLSRDRLLETAAELGISPEAVAAAERELAKTRDTRELRAEYRASRRKEFNAHLLSFVIVNGFLVALNLVTDYHVFWAIFPILGWGIGLAFHFAAAFLGLGEDEDDYRKWLEKRKAAATTTD